MPIARVHRIPASAPDDVSGIEAAIAAGRLDPAGIREIRQTMRDLGSRGKTVLVSSHILSEVEQVADTVSIIGHGRLLGQGPVADLIGSGAVPRARVVVADPATARDVLAQAGLTVAAEDPGDGGRDDAALLVDGAADPAEITRLLAARGLYLSELTPLRPDLESVFLQMTADEGLSGSGAPMEPAADGTDAREERS